MLRGRVIRYTHIFTVFGLSALRLRLYDPSARMEIEYSVTERTHIYFAYKITGMCFGMFGRNHNTNIIMRRRALKTMICRHISSSRKLYTSPSSSSFDYVNNTAATDWTTHIYTPHVCALCVCTYFENGCKECGHTHALTRTCTCVVGKCGE